MYGAVDTIAARAVVYAFRNLGVTYSQKNRNATYPNKFDCSSLVYRAYLAGGAYQFFTSAPSTAAYGNSNRNAWRSVLERTSSPQAGDIRILWRKGASIDTSWGDNGHAQLVLNSRYVIQSGGTKSNRVNVSPLKTKPGWKDRFFRYSPR